MILQYYILGFTFQNAFFNYYGRRKNILFIYIVPTRSSYYTRMLCSVIIIYVKLFHLTMFFIKHTSATCVCNYYYCQRCFISLHTLSIYLPLFENNHEDSSIVNVLLQCAPFTNIKWIHCCGIRLSTNGKFSSRSHPNVYIPLRESYYKCSYRSRSRLSSFVEICKHH